MTFKLRGGKLNAVDRTWRMRHYVQRRAGTICPRRNRHAGKESPPDKLRSTIIAVSKVWFKGCL